MYEYVLKENGIPSKRGLWREILLEKVLYKVSSVVSSGQLTNDTDHLYLEGLRPRRYLCSLR